jgi:hypothetical protein
MAVSDAQIAPETRRPQSPATNFPNVSPITLSGGKALYFLGRRDPCAGRQEGNPMTDIREASLQAIYVRFLGSPLRQTRSI